MRIIYLISSLCMCFFLTSYTLEKKHIIKTYELSHTHPIEKVIIKGKEELIHLEGAENGKKRLSKLFKRKSRTSNEYITVTTTYDSAKKVKNPYKFSYNSEKKQLTIRTRKRDKEFLYSSKIKVPYTISKVRVKSKGPVEYNATNDSVLVKGWVQKANSRYLVHHPKYIECKALRSESKSPKKSTGYKQEIRLRSLESYTNLTK